MGSNFFNPLQSLNPLSRFIGGNSFLAKEMSYDPLMKSGVGKAIDPNGYAAGQAYANRNVVGSNPTPFARVDPTLQDATNGYVQATRNAQNNNLYGGAPVGTGQKSAYQV